MELFGRNLRSLVTCPTPTSRQIPVRDNTRYRFGVALHGHGTPYFTSLMIPPRRYLLVPHSSLLLAKAGAGLFQLVVTEFVFSKIINYATLRAAQVKAKVRDWLTPFAWELNYMIVARELNFSFQFPVHASTACIIGEKNRHMLICALLSGPGSGFRYSEFERTPFLEELSYRLRLTTVDVF